MKVQNYFKKQQSHGWVGKGKVGGVLLLAHTVAHNRRLSVSPEVPQAKANDCKRQKESRAYKNKKKKQRGGKGRQGRADAIKEGVKSFMFHA